MSLASEPVWIKGYSLKVTYGYPPFIEEKVMHQCPFTSWTATGALPKMRTENKFYEKRAFEKKQTIYNKHITHATKTTTS